MARRGRTLTPDEAALWNEIARRARRLHPEKAQAPRPDPVKKPEPQPPRGPVPVPHSIVPFRLGEKAATSIGSLTPPAPASPVDPKTLRRLRRGQMRPEGRIDLHGMTLDESYANLMEFICESYDRNRRMVLVITGKSGPDNPSPLTPGARGLLRRQVPRWLALAPFNPMILSVESAHRQHGGDGAFYVYLRRRKG